MCTMTMSMTAGMVQRWCFEGDGLGRGHSWGIGNIQAGVLGWGWHGRSIVGVRNWAEMIPSCYDLRQAGWAGRFSLSVHSAMNLCGYTSSM